MPTQPLAADISRESGRNGGMSDKTKYRERQEQIGRTIRELLARPLPVAMLSCSVCDARVAEGIAVGCGGRTRYFCHAHAAEADVYANSLGR